jgi:putative two-component system response regulator
MNGHVLVVDDVRPNVKIAAKVLSDDGHRVSVAMNGNQAIKFVGREHPDLILLDVLMPELDGFEVCRRIKSNPATRLIPIILVTALQGAKDRIRGIEAGADDFVTKPFDTLELCARVRSLIRLKRFTDELDSAESVVLGLAQAIEARDGGTEGHCQRLARLAEALGAHLGLAGEDLVALRRGGFLHDVGKVGIPDAVLLKPGRLTPAEYDCMKCHTVIGEQLCGSLRALRNVRPIVRHHHERLDGTGYPDRLRGDAIPLLAQIVGIVDVFDALTSERPYKPALSRDMAYTELLCEAARGWRRPDLVDSFIALDTCHPPGDGPCHESVLS